LFITSCTETDKRTVATDNTEPVKNIIDPVLTTPDQNEPTSEELIAVEPNFIEPDTVSPVPDINEIAETSPADTNMVVIDINDSNETAEGVVFHDYCAEIFTEFVNSEGMVNYEKLHRGRLKLFKLLNKFKNLDPDEYKSWPKEDRIAFWINAYNIKLLTNIIDNYPIPETIFSRIWRPNSIRNIPPTNKIGIAKWESYKFYVMQEEFTLPMIEQRFFRETFKDPRVYFALSSGAVGGPLLRNEPYYGDKLYKQLEDQTRKFFNSKHGLIIDREEQKVYLYSYLKTYGKEFIPKYKTDKKFKDHKPDTRAVLNFLTNYLSRRDISFLETGNYTIHYINYNWTLNE
jgi:hypothetical protein